MKKISGTETKNLQMGPNSQSRAVERKSEAEDQIKKVFAGFRLMCHRNLKERHFGWNFSFFPFFNMGSNFLQVLRKIEKKKEKFFTCFGPVFLTKKVK